MSTANHPVVFINTMLSDAVNRFILYDKYDDVVNDHYLGFTNVRNDFKSDRGVSLTYLNQTQDDKRQLLFTIDFLSDMSRLVITTIAAKLKDKVFVLPKREGRIYFLFKDVVVNEDNIPVIRFTECENKWKDIISEEWVIISLRHIQEVLNKHKQLVMYPLKSLMTNIDGIKEIEKELDLLKKEKRLLGYQLTEGKVGDDQYIVIVNEFISPTNVDLEDWSIQSPLFNVISLDHFKEKEKAIACNNWVFDWCGFIKTYPNTKQVFETTTL